MENTVAKIILSLTQLTGEALRADLSADELDELWNIKQQAAAILYKYLNTFEAMTANKGEK